MKFKWRKWNNILHRDLGYFFFGLTLIYAISGFATNHLREWDSNFITETKELRLNNISRETSVTRDVVEDILEQMGEAGNYKSHFRASRNRLQIFLHKGNIEVDMEYGIGFMEYKINRPVLRHMNFLHLNHGKKLWTWVADIYAVGLFLLAVTGLFVLKGKKGFGGRGKWFVIAGVVVPIIFLLLYFH